MIYSMTAVTPRSVIDSISYLLTKSGELKGEEEAESLLVVMKEATMLFQKSIYLEVLKNTKSDEKLLNTFLTKGGWDLLNTWLTDAKKTSRIALSLELLSVMEQLPVTLGLLKQGTMGKVVKSMAKEGPPELREVRRLAETLVERWMKLVKDTPNSKKKKDGKKDVNGGKKSKTQLAESAGFLDAITSSSKPSLPKKVRKRSSTDQDYRRTNSQSEVTTPEPSPLPKSSKVDKLGEEAVVRGVSPPKEVIKPEFLLSNSPPPLPEKSHGNDNMFCFRRAKKRRRIRWRDELEEVQFFECEERGAHKNFADSMMKEYEKERMAVMRCKLGEDMMVEMLPWRHPLKLELDQSEPVPDLGSGSIERELQRNRERNVLAVLVFDQGRVDESPKEPDPQELSYTYEPPKEIPLEEKTAAAAVVPMVPVITEALPPLPDHPPPMPVLPEMMIPLPEQYPVQRYGGGGGGGGHYNGGGGGGGRTSYNSYQDRGYSEQPGGRNGGGWHRNNSNNRSRGYRGEDEGPWDRRQRSGGRRPCAYFNTAQGCRSGNHCNFVHERGGLRREDVAAMRRDEGPGMRRDEGPGMRRDEGPGMRRDEGPGMRRDEGPGMRRDEGPGMRRDEVPGMRRDDVPGMRRDDVPGMRREEGPGMRREESPGMIVGDRMNGAPLPYSSSRWEEREERRSAVHIPPGPELPLKEPETLPEQPDSLT